MSCGQKPMADLLRLPKSSTFVHIMYAVSIDKQVINEMPLVNFEGHIHVIDAVSGVKSAVMALRTASVVGFDTETRPSFKRGEHHTVALLQLSTNTDAFLFRLRSKFPFVTFGLLGTHRFGNVPWTELRASANFKPSKVLGASVSAAAGSFGFSWGAAMNLNLKVINLFLGMDAIPTRFTPQFIPLGKANLGLSFGINITY